MSDLEVVLAARNDWANVGYEFSQALRSVGVRAEMFVQNLHGFSYPNQGTKVDNIMNIAPIARRAKAVIFMHTIYFNFALPDHVWKVVFHGGTAYGRNPKRANALMEKIGIDVSIVQTYNLWPHDAPNKVLMMPAVNTDEIQPKYGPFGKRRILMHSPRSATVKGSGRVTAVIRELSRKKLFDKNNWVFSYRPAQTGWKDYLNRIAHCEAYIESQSYTVDWGVTAIEPAALGSVVITNFRGEHLYRREYGDHPIQVANSPSELRGAILRVLELPEDELKALQHKSRKWAVENHGYQAVGRRLIEKALPALKYKLDRK